MTDTAVLVFARAPVPGAAKTRLMPLLGADGAAAASAALTRRAVSVAVRAAVGPVELWCAPDSSHPFLAGCAHAAGAILQAQCEGDIGCRMAHAFDRALCRYPRALLIGADAVSLDPGTLRDAAAALCSHDAVFAPAEDGGYLLVGLNRPHAALFRDIEWGGPQVWAQTRTRLDALALRRFVLPTGYDVDRPEDWRRAQREGRIEAPAC